MTQTTGQVTKARGKVFISPDGTTWTNVTGHQNSLVPSDGARIIGQTHTSDGDTPLLTDGDRVAITVTCNFVYTEADSEPFDVCRTAHESGDAEFWVQWEPVPLGNWFKTGEGKLENILYPDLDSASGDAIMSQFIMKAQGLTEAAAST